MRRFHLIEHSPTTALSKRHDNTYNEPDQEQDEDYEQKEPNYILSRIRSTRAP